MEIEKSIKKYLIHALLVLISSGIGFWGGLTYSKPKIDPSMQNGKQFSGNMMRGSGTRGQGFTIGEIISKDATSITVSTKDNGSKVVILPSTLQVNKNTPGTLDDITIGEKVMVNGTQQPDGSIVAGTIQIQSPTQGIPNPIK